MDAKIVILKQDLKAFEDKYQMSSGHFYKLFCNGKLDDREDFMAWAGLWELFHLLRGKQFSFARRFMAQK